MTLSRAEKHCVYRYNQRNRERKETMKSGIRRFRTKLTINVKDMHCEGGCRCNIRCRPLTQKQYNVV